MDTSAFPQTERPAPRGGYESSDANPKGVFLFVVGLAIVGVVIHFVLRWMFADLQRGAHQADQLAGKLEVVPSVAAYRPYFPSPREQISPQLDLAALRARENAELEGYGWVDKKAGVVRIPIDRAMELLSQRGLPVRAGTNAPRIGPSSLQLQQQRPVQSTPPGKEEGK